MAHAQSKVSMAYTDGDRDVGEWFEGIKNHARLVSEPGMVVSISGWGSNGTRRQYGKLAMARPPNRP